MHGSSCDFTGISNEMTQQERAVVVPQMIKGFNGMLICNFA